MRRQSAGFLFWCTLLAITGAGLWVVYHYVDLGEGSGDGVESRSVKELEALHTRIGDLERQLRSVNANLSKAMSSKALEEKDAKSRWNSWLSSMEARVAQLEYERQKTAQEKQMQQPPIKKQAVETPSKKEPRKEPSVKWRKDYRCGPNKLDGGGTATCNPEGNYACCSPGGWCGLTNEHCACKACVDYRAKPPVATEYPGIAGYHKSFNRSVAIVLPYRDRLPHWKKLEEAIARNAHSSERRQIRFDIYVVEQANRDLFNRGWLFNVGFILATQDGKEPNCVAIHDVDMMPSEAVDYGWCEVPLLLSSEMTCWKDRSPYLHYVGGVVSMAPKDWRAVNGFSNSYEGWGGEDDDLFFRLYQNKLLRGTCRPFCDEYKPTAMAILRPPPGGGRFTCLHDKDHTARVEPKDKESITKRLRRLEAGEQLWREDGLTAIKYHVKRLNTTASSVGPFNVHWVYVTKFPKDNTQPKGR